MIDIVIEGKAFVNGRIQKCCIGIDEGKILSVKKILKGEKNLDFGDKLILPAGIDAHVHFRDPGQTHKEDFFTGTMSAAFGGISCILDMPNTVPPTTTIDALDEKIGIAKRKGVVDFGSYAEINKNAKQIPFLSKKCIAFKLYLPELRDDLDILRKVPEDKVIAVHAEDRKCIQKHGKKSKNLLDHSNSRPIECEIKGIKKVIGATKSLKNLLHICHCSSMEGIKLSKLKNRNQQISVGTTPHHLLLSTNSDFRGQSFGKVNPPLREEKDRAKLFDKMRDGEIDILESDHAPHLIEEKKKNFDDAPAGLPGVETMLPLFLFLVKKEWISLPRLVGMVSERPAEIFHIKKGKISQGRDADLLVTDFKERKIKSKDMHSKCGWTPFEGMEAIFPTNLFLRGERIIEDREFVGEKGYGKFIGE